MVLDGALPQVLARLLVHEMEDERVLLAEAARVVLGHQDGELLLGEGHLLDLRPVEQADFVVAYGNLLLLLLQTQKDIQIVTKILLKFGFYWTYLERGCVVV